MRKLACTLAFVGGAALALAAAQAPPSAAASFPDLAGMSLQDRRSALAASIGAEGGVDARVLDAVRLIPREEFLPPYLRALAYEDSSLPLGGGGLLPSPSDLVRIAEAFAFTASDKLLIYGLDTGYAAALFSRLAARVWDIELVAAKRLSDERVFSSVGIRNVAYAVGSDPGAFASAGPFDKILVHGAVEEIPPGLLAQLKPGGELIAPLLDASGFQMLVMVQGAGASLSVRSVGKCFFPVIAHAGS